MRPYLFQRISLEVPESYTPANVVEKDILSNWHNLNALFSAHTLADRNHIKIGQARRAIRQMVKKGLIKRYR